MCPAPATAICSFWPTVTPDNTTLGKMPEPESDKRLVVSGVVALGRSIDFERKREGVSPLVTVATTVILQAPGVYVIGHRLVID